MNIGSLKSIGSSLSGNIEAAKIIIYDFRKSSKPSVAELANASGMLGNKLKAEGLAKMGQAMASATSAALQAAGTGASAPIVNMEGSETKIFNVHFNPSSLQVYSNFAPTRQSDTQGGPPSTGAETAGSLTLTVTLFFDEVNVLDSFMLDGLMTGASAQTVKNIVSFGQKAAGKIWSVQDEVEGLVSALRNPYTRNICFRWADFSFTGQLNNVMAQYSVFSKSGRPVRAQVVLRINHIMDSLYLNSWYNDFKQAFQGSASQTSDAAKALGNLSGLSV